jgi:hypothetical protein
MDSRTRSFVVIALAVLAWVGPGVRSSDARQVRVEGFFPRQLPPGQVTVISLAVPSRDAIQGAEIAPAAGVTVSGIKQGSGIQGALTWSELTIDVAKDAAPGDRTLVLLMPMGRSAPITITIPNHVPGIAEVRIVPATSNPAALEVQFVATDASADLGESPYVWFSIGCRGDPTPGVVHGAVTAGSGGKASVRAIVPKPRSATGACTMAVRMTDRGGIESNTVRVPVDLKN